MSRLSLKALQAAAGAGGAATYVDDVFSTYLYDGNGTAQTINNGIALGDGPANGTVLHLTGDSLVDSSPSSKTVTNNNSVSVSTSVKKYGTGSLQFDGVDQYLSIASSADFNFGTNDFTIEGWFYAQSDSDDRGAIFELYASDNDMLRVMINTGGVLEFRMQAGGANQMTITTTSWSNNTWHHFAVVNYSGTINCYLDGTSFGSSSSFTIPNLSSAQVLVGLDLYATDRWYTGYIDDLRVTKNRAVYTANFTPPSSAHSLDTQVTGDGGMVWLKGRYQIGNTSNSVTGTIADTVRGATKFSYDELTAAEGTNSGHITRFTSDGFDVGSYSLANDNNMRMVAWSFRKQPGFFDVVTYTGNGVAGRTVSHNLGSVPGFMVVKKLNSTSDFTTYHRSMGATKYAPLNDTDAYNVGTAIWNSTEPTATEFTVGDNTRVNNNGDTFVAYLFAHDAQDFGEDSDEAIIKCGYYTGNTSSKPNIDLGFEPQWVMIKCATHSENWIILDSMRGIVTPDSSGIGADARLLADSSNAETTSSSTSYIKLHANGFELTGTGGEINAASRDYIYVAIARPNKPASELTATDLFMPVVKNFTAGLIETGFPVDLNVNFGTSADDYNRFTARLTGQKSLYSDRTVAEGTETYWDFAENEGMGVTYSGNISGYSNLCFKRSPGFFDVVAYAGNGTLGRTVPHNLGVTPELMISKLRNATKDWYVYSSSEGAGKRLTLNDNSTPSNTGAFNSTAPTAASFTVGDGQESNGSGYNYIAYLFATVAGISKIGTYTGTGSDLNVDCGFSAGARFVLIKRTDSTGDWYFWDTARGIVAGNDPYHRFNVGYPGGQDVTNTDYIDPLSSGFTITSSAPAALNASGGTYLFLAIA